MDRRETKEQRNGGNVTGEHNRSNPMDCNCSNSEKGNRSNPMDRTRPEIEACNRHEAEAAGEALTVREKKPVRLVGLFVMAAGLLFLILELLFHEGDGIPLWIYGVILLILISGAAVYMNGRNRRLEVQETDKLCYVNLFGRRREFSLKDIDHVRAVCDVSGRQDYIRIYDRTGGRLCLLECNMENSCLFLMLLQDRGIRIDTPDESRNLLTELVLQVRIPQEDAKRVAEEACAQAGRMLEDWQRKNERTGASFDYGLVQYRRKKLSAEAQIQPAESRYEGRITEKLPEDYICVLEVYVKKDGLFVLDRKKRLLMFGFPLLYQRKLTVQGERTALCYNKGCQSRLEETLKALKHYLPGHRFFQEDICLGYELKKTLD